MSRSPRRRKKRKKQSLLFFLALAFFILFAVFWTVNQDGQETSVKTSSQGYADQSRSCVDSAPDSIPDYSGTDVIELNGNNPNFTMTDCTEIIGEVYSPLDNLGRCGTATAKLDRSMMPKAEREEIGQIKPSGWKQNKYPGVVDSDPPYLYNRCHLIAYALTGQNANEKNLITGTRYMNATTMLPYEIRVMQYLDNSENHVLYRVSPYFKGSELLARGVEIEAYSIEDNGKDLCFHVFVYNIQPGITIDYRTGDNKLE